MVTIIFLVTSLKKLHNTHLSDTQTRRVEDSSNHEWKKLYLINDSISMTDKALRYNDGKPEWTLVDFDSLEPMVKVLEY